MFQSIRLIISVLFVTTLATGYAGETVVIDDFETDQLTGWEKESFKGETRYRLISLNSQQVLQAVATDSASGIAKERRVDLKATPYLNWRWNTDSLLSYRDEQTKSGDDYVARIYVVINGGLRFWKTTAVNYVWSSHQPVGTIWDNAYAPENAKMIAVRGENSETGWHREKRNVYQDLIATFGDKGSDLANEKHYRYIDAVAIMTDTDDGGGRAQAYYDNIFFSRD